jgi:hypothetical protein
MNFLGVRSVARGFLQLAVDALLNATDREEFNVRFRLAGFDLAADLELPFPGAGR